MADPRKRRGARRRPKGAEGAPTSADGQDAIPGPPRSVSGDVQLSTYADRADDAALVAGLAVDDPPAATAFVRRFQGQVFGLALSVTRDSSLAEDVAQEAFVRAWRAATTYDSRRGSVVTWILTITRNAAIDAVRSRRGTPTDQEQLDQLLHDTMTAPDPAEAALRRLERDHAVHRLTAIPREQARAVVLAVIGGCTAAEVSQREGIPLGTAKTRIRSGLRRLRQAMEEERRD
jgi:RNA polymerase sigma factor (sigma-70 family)